jgi:hypothetical protein
MIASKLILTIAARAKKAQHSNALARTLSPPNQLW